MPDWLFEDSSIAVEIGGLLFDDVTRFAQALLLNSMGVEVELEGGADPAEEQQIVSKNNSQRVYS